MIKDSIIRKSPVFGLRGAVRPLTKSSLAKAPNRFIRAEPIPVARVYPKATLQINFRTCTFSANRSIRLHIERGHLVRALLVPSELIVGGSVVGDDPTCPDPVG